MKSIPALQGNILRPLLSCDPKLIETYAQNHGILYNHDESNLKSEYLRNFFRNTIIPAIEDRLPHFSMNVVKSVCLIQDASEILDDQYDQWRKINVLINNAVAPSTEVDKRTFAFDLIPTKAMDKMVIIQIITL